MIQTSATAMSPARYIRERVFSFRTQQEFADALAYTQAQISRFETGSPFSSEAQERIRGLARERGIRWDNNWFFEVPADVEATERCGGHN